MDFIVLLTGFGAGFMSMLFWRLINSGMIEGNREDYTLKIGLLKKEQNELIKQLRHTESLLETANTDCHRLQDRLKAQANELQMMVNMNHDLKTALRDTSNGLDMIRKTTVYVQD